MGRRAQCSPAARHASISRFSGLDQNTREWNIDTMQWISTEEEQSEEYICECIQSTMCIIDDARLLTGIVRDGFRNSDVSVSHAPRRVKR
jgi:hypothetical protein